MLEEPKKTPAAPLQNNSWQVLVARGDTLWQAGQLNDAITEWREYAIAAYQKALKIKPDLWRVYQDIGNILLQQGRIDQAFDAYLQLIKLNPQFQSVYYRLWWTKASATKLEEAIACCQQAMRKVNLPIIQTTLGNLLTQQGRIEEGICAYQQAVRQQTILAYPELATEYSNSPHQQNPDFFVLGAMKCGSTTLYHYLCQHPQIIPSLTKEIQFFDDHYRNGINWYLAHFPAISNNKSWLTGEATPCFSTPGVWRKLHRWFPNIKLIILLREPVARAYSHYQHSARYYGVNHSFEDAIAVDLANESLSQKMLRNGRAYRQVRSVYISFSLYVYWLQEWLKFFPQEQLLIVDSTELFKQPVSTMKKVFTFLNLPDHHLPNYSKENSGSYQPLSDSLRLSLSQYFYPHNRKLEELLDRKFNWH